jgi:hypothetical protein
MLMPWMQTETQSIVSFDRHTIFGERPGRDSAIAVAVVWNSLEVAAKLIEFGVDFDAKGR